MNRNKHKATVVFGFLFVLVLMMTGCGKSESGTPEKPESSATPSAVTETVSSAAVVTPTPSATVVEEKEESHENQAKSLLTGLWIDKKKAARRPYAVMINNISLANPQSGLSQASVLYEAIVEGGITRMMGIFEDFDTDRIGSTRSARHYFVSFADEYDAIFCHFGHTSYALNKISELGVDNLSGLAGYGSLIYYRDNSIAAPHNAFASYKGIIKGTKELGYRTKYRDGFKGHFKFYEEDTDLDRGKAAGRVTIFFSSYTSPYFEYDTKTKEYKRFQFGGKHIDANTKQQLSFKNIIIMYVNQWDIDSHGYQTMDISETAGDGMYITNGKKIDITWEKSESAHQCIFYDKKTKKQLVMNPGKTYVGVVPYNSYSYVTIEKDSDKK